MNAHGFFSFGNAPEDPSWMVKITTQTNDSQIYGTGYIVSIGEMFFVRTSSHVTLGTEKLVLTTGTEEALKIRIGESLSDNSKDDQLIRIEKPEQSEALAYYAPAKKGFVIYPEVYLAILENERKRELGAWTQDTAYIVPSWGKSKPGEFDPPKKSMHTNTRPGKFNRDYVRSNASMLSLMSEVRVFPGESGSPAFFRTYAGDVRDLNGNYFEPLVPNSSGVAPMVMGHIQNFQLFFNRSNFSHPENTEEIVQAYLEGKRGSLDSTEWRKSGGHIYRSTETDKGTIREINLLGSIAGEEVIIDPSIQDSSDATEENMLQLRRLVEGILGGRSQNVIQGDVPELDLKSLELEQLQMNVGNGIKMDGGSCDNPAGCKRASIGLGMIYHNQSITGFKIEEELKYGGKREFFLYGSWENYIYVRDHLSRQDNISFEPVSTEIPLGDLIKEKAELNGQNRYRMGDYCYIDSHALEENRLVLWTQTYEEINLDLTLPQFFPITFVKSRYEHDETFILDLRGLFSVDASEMNAHEDGITSKSEFDHFKDRPFVRIRHPEYRDVIFECKIR